MTHHQLHERAMAASRRYLELESELIEHLIEIDQTALYKKYEVESLFAYVLKFWNLSRAVTYAFIAVARKSCEVPALRMALAERRLTVATANRLVSQIDGKNAEELIEDAACLSSRELERKLHALDPERANQKTLKIPAALLEEIKRIRDFEPGTLNLTETLAKIVHDYRLRHDPVEKAKRAMARKKESGMQSESGGLCAPRYLGPNRTGPNALKTQVSKMRIPLKAAEKHAVMARDEGRCTFKLADGSRCRNERFIDIHHVRQVQNGGSNELDNLQILCGFHHDLVHQLSFPIGEEHLLRLEQRPQS